ncbi:MAG: flavin reductase family protein [Haliscomenobacter sp.]
MKSVDPTSIPVPDLNQFLVGAIAPRPIAFISTIDESGISNIAPYSFFNVFSVNPPVLAFSCTRKPGENPQKDTLHNISLNQEAVINTVPWAIVRQMTIASMEYPAQVDEFIKSGLTPIASELVTPFRIAESPVQMECRVRDIIPLGEKPGSSTLVLCDVLRIHISESILDENERIDPHKIDLAARMGRAFYVRASGPAVHVIAQPFSPTGIGFDQLPASIRHSTLLTGNELGQLAAQPAIPDPELLEALKGQEFMQSIWHLPDARLQLQLKIQHTLADGNPDFALQLAFLMDALPSVA